MKTQMVIPNNLLLNYKLYKPILTKREGRPKQFYSVKFVLIIILRVTRKKTVGGNVGFAKAGGTKQNIAGRDQTIKDQASETAKAKAAKDKKKKLEKKGQLN